MYISLYDLGLFILFAVIIIAGGYLIAVLHRAFCLLGSVREVLESHSGDIADLLSALPKVLANVNELAVSLQHAMEQTSSALAPLQDGFIDTVDELRDSLETFLLYAKMIGGFLRALFSKA